MNHSLFSKIHFTCLVIAFCIVSPAFAVIETTATENLTTATERQIQVVETEKRTPVTSVTQTSTQTVETWRERMTSASIADNFSEAAGAQAVTYNELLETTTPENIQGRGRVNGPRKFYSTAEIVKGKPVGSQPKGSLSGRIVFASGGHGWTNDTTTGLWYTQRPETHGVVEDFGNLDQYNLFADFAFRAGATVVPMRPLGHQSLERTCDNSRASQCKFQGPWYDSKSNIFFGSTRGREEVPYRYAIASSQETAVARFRPFIPKSDYYPIYCWARDGVDRVMQTYRVVHTGGAIEVRVNHRRVGKGWVYLGEYFLQEGWGSYVEVTNKVDEPYDADGKHVVIADAIRFGNGLGDVNRGGGISGAPREEEAARYWLQRSIGDAVPAIFDAFEGSDQETNVSSPPRLSSHMNRESEGTFFDRVFISFHSNAVGGRGVVGLFNQSPDRRPDHQEDYALTIAKQVQDDLTTTDALKLPVPWYVRQRLTVNHINFGEIRKDVLNNEMVGTINEVAFHDNYWDAMLLRDPQVRIAFARSTYKAILSFLQRLAPDHPVAVVAPETPVIHSATIDTSSTVHVAWGPPGPNPIGGAAPTAYRVFHSTNGYAFDGGRLTTGGMTMKFDGLSTATAHYFRVTSVNDGGESNPSRTLGVFQPVAPRKSVLLVSAFNTMNEDLNLSQTAANLGAPGRPKSEFVRIIPRLMNPGTQIAITGADLAATDRGFESSTMEGITSGIVNIEDYKAIVVLFGRQSVRDILFSADLQTSLGTYIRRGGNLFASGANVLCDLDEPTTRPNSKCRAFAAERLRARFAGEEYETLEITGERGTLLSTATIKLSAPTGNLAIGLSNDKLRPVAGSHALLRYDDDERSVAAVHSGNGERRNVFVFGFPFEMIGDEATRRDILGTVMKTCGIKPEVKPQPPVIRPVVQKAAPQAKKQSPARRSSSTKKTTRRARNR